MVNRADLYVKRKAPFMKEFLTQVLRSEDEAISQCKKRMKVEDDFKLVRLRI